jgi:hypothetical protein
MQLPTIDDPRFPKLDEELKKKGYTDPRARWAMRKLTKDLSDEKKAKANIKRWLEDLSAENIQMKTKKYTEEAKRALTKLGLGAKGTETKANQGDQSGADTGDGANEERGWKPLEEKDLPALWKKLQRSHGLLQWDFEEHTPRLLAAQTKQEYDAIIHEMDDPIAIRPGPQTAAIGEKELTEFGNFAYYFFHLDSPTVKALMRRVVNQDTVEQSKKMMEELYSARYLSGTQRAKIEAHLKEQFNPYR